MRNRTKNQSTFFNPKVLGILLCVSVVALIYFVDFTSDEQRDAAFYTPSYLVDEIYFILFTVDEVLRCHNATYWISQETLLGAVRHNGLMQWENEVSFEMSSVDLPKLRSMKQMFKLYKIEVITISEGFAAYKKSEDTKYPMATVRFVKENRDSYVNSEGDISLHKGEVLPLKRYKFGCFEVTGPNNPFPYLSRRYGEDWQIMGEKKGHRRFKLRETDYKPAEPCTPHQPYACIKS